MHVMMKPTTAKRIVAVVALVLAGLMILSSLSVLL